MLRIAAALHVLFHVKSSVNEEKDKDEDGDCEDGDYDDVQNDVQSDNSVPPEISEDAFAAAINFVQLCCQQTAFMAGRGSIQEKIEIVNASMYAWRDIQQRITIFIFTGLTEPASTSSSQVTKTCDDTPRFCLKLPGKQPNSFAICKEV